MPLWSGTGCPVCIYYNLTGQIAIEFASRTRRDTAGSGLDWLREASRGYPKFQTELALLFVRDFQVGGQHRTRISPRRQSTDSAEMHSIYTLCTPEPATHSLQYKHTYLFDLVPFCLCQQARQRSYDRSHADSKNTKRPRHWH